LDQEAWRRLLGECGFVDVEAVSDAPADGVPGQSVLVARVPAPVEETRAPWLVLPDRGGVAEQLATRLQPAVFAGDELPADIRGVVDLRALDAVDDDPLAASVASCAAVTEL